MIDRAAVLEEGSGTGDTSDPCKAPLENEDVYLEYHIISCL